MKKKTKSKFSFHEKVFHSHPAAASAESDGVKLIKELEALRKQKNEQIERIKSSEDAIEAARIECLMIVNRSREIIDMTNRISRVTDVQISNVEELLKKIVHPRDECRNGCAA